MASRLAARRATLAAALAAVALAGCSAPTSSAPAVTGTTLTIYASQPPPAARDDRTADVLAAEELAIAESGASVGHFKVRLRVLAGGKLSDNARTAIKDSDAIAYLGELLPGESADSVGITNAQDLLQVSPSDTDLELTRASAAVSGAPNSLYEAQKNYGRTFARVVPTTAMEARAIASELAAEHVSKLYLCDDGQAYGSALAQAVKQAASGFTVVQGPPSVSAVSAAGADALLYATSSRSSAASLFDAVAAAAPQVKLFGPSALDSETFAGALSPAAQRSLRVSAPGFTPAALPAAGKTFAAQFQTVYHRAPTTEAIFGYEAMSALLGVLREAGTRANDRATVVRDFLAIRDRSSVLGTYSITSGDVSIAPFVFSRASAGRLTPYKYLSVSG